ncbi:glycosyltransferase [Gordonia soli]|uniref:Putative glycosyltransferase n=1 Tax=Gordonia soli NBRC 108243 TaxID=1223545 RepID=M0QJK3_9ACTN|nr:glycosyltransferase [Gordonia soli]GAC68634.1 putative glycosyltransferase [Gordonia soli NBRC 108243]
MSPRITLLAFGTRGDVAPLTGLGARLRDSLGAAVTIAAQRPYEDLVTEAGLGFRMLPRDTEADTRASEYGQAMVDGRKLRPSKEALAGMRDDLAGVGEAMAAASEDADLILCGGPVGMMLGRHVAEAIGVPSAAVVLQPSYPTGDFAPPPLGTRSYGRSGNRLAWRLAAMGEKLFMPLIGDLRTNLGLPERSLKEIQRAKAEWSQIVGVSGHVVPRPRDWPDHVHLTGYWWPDEGTTFEPSDELVAFLADGPAPVYIGLGSTAISNGPEVGRIIRDAVRSAGRRAVIHRGWAHLDAGDVECTTDFMAVDDVPHEWLLPRTAAAVHHCGAGTTAATLRAGIPSVALPGIMDQPFWARRLHRLGVAPAPIARVGVESGDLAAAIGAVLDDDDAGHRRAAADLARLFADEDGAEVATRVVESLLDRSRIS